MKNRSRGRKRLDSAMRSVLSTKQDRPRLIPALLGAYVNGQKTIVVAGRPDFVWVRLRGTTSEVVNAFNDAVGLHYDLPILVYRDPEQPEIWKIYGRDIRAYSDWDGVSYLPPHGDSHSFSGKNTTGVDPVWVSKRQYMPLLPRPVASGTFGIWLEPDIYYFEGQYRYWPGSGTSSLAGYLPTGSTTARFVTVYLNQAGNPAYLAGEEYTMIPPPPDIASYIELPTPSQGVPIAAVRLYTGTTSINWGDIYDLRSPQAPLPATGTKISVFDESVYLGAVYGFNFVGNKLEAIVTGSYAHIVHNSTGSMVIYDEGGFLGVFDEMRFIGAGVSVYNSGSYAAIAITGSAVDLPATGSFTIYDEGVLLGQAYGMNFVGDGVQAVLSGTVAHIMHTGSGGGGGHATGTVVIYDEGQWLGVFDELRFIGPGVSVYNSGSYAAISISGTSSGGGGGSGINTTGTRSTYALVGEPVPLDTITGAYWKVPTDIYASGSLNLFIDGLSQKAGLAFTEHLPMSGTFHWEFPLPTGIQLEAKWGHPVDRVLVGLATYTRSAEANPLKTITGGYWQVPDLLYATGSLAVMVNGIWQVPVIDFEEQFPASGTFTIIGSGVPTGSRVAAIYGVPL